MTNYKHNQNTPAHLFVGSAGPGQPIVAGGIGRPADFFVGNSEISEILKNFHFAEKHISVVLSNT